MENFQGDLTDIFRASSSGDHQPSSSSAAAAIEVPQSSNDHQLSSSSSNWEFPISDHLNLSSSHFGDPFCNMRDPLLHFGSGLSYFGSTSPPPPNDHVLNQVRAISSSSPPLESQTSTAVICGANSNNKVFVELDHEINKSPSCDVFSRIQISHNNPNSDNSPVLVAATSSSCSSPPRAFKACNNNSMVSIDMMNTNNNISKSCLIDNNGSPLQISSPRNLGIKRRKSQAKKVVCIPAAAAANSRPSGEVVPSDLWAWRKYGQKPIKGSPYPRGYYRCSSSKGCSARKQVERSRTDPNMLVITYTSEHNHPWPTQRNALAGSTRSQPPKTTCSSSSRTQHLHHKTTKIEQHNNNNESSSNDNCSSSPPASINIAAAVKEENVDFDNNNKQIMDDDHQFHDHNINNSYRPSLPDDSSIQSEDFFADLDEIEADPLQHHDLLFQPDHKQTTKGLDPFNIFDWSAGSDHHISKKRL